jgi:hypothetical protein
MSPRVYDNQLTTLHYTHLHAEVVHQEMFNKIKIPRHAIAISAENFGMKNNLCPQAQND